MLGYITGFAEGQVNALLAEVAATLRAEGVVLAGVVQVNTGEGRGCPMDLHVLGGAEVVRISQDLGQHSQGCRLNPDGLERAVALVEARLETGAALLIVNRFGKQEAEGRGFRPLIGHALAGDVPVVLAVSDEYLTAFEGFSEGFGQPLAPSHAAILAFCRGVLA